MHSRKTYFTETDPRQDPDVVIVGNRGESNIGDSFARSCRSCGYSFKQVESSDALSGSSFLRRLRWHALGRTPLRLEQFSGNLARLCAEARPRLLLSVGLAPVNRYALRQIGGFDCARAIYLTDDPWSPAQKASWFMSALPNYDFVFTTRCANIQDLKRVGAGEVIYLPFGWDPAICPDRCYSSDELRNYRADIVFAGGGDAERVPYIDALARAGFSIALYGTYWDRFRPTRGLTRGQLPVTELPKAIAGAAVALCLVRRLNRDGHCMRTYEIPAMNGCMLAEHTEEHRTILGPDGEAVVYFRSINEMVGKAKWLLEHRADRERLAANAKRRIRVYENTYEQRLLQIIRTCYPTSSRGATPKVLI